LVGRGLVQPELVQGVVLPAHGVLNRDREGPRRCRRRAPGCGACAAFTPRRQRPFDGPWLAEDDEQVGACRAVGLGPALLPVLQRAEVEAVPRGEGGLRETTPAADRSDLGGTE